MATLTPFQEEALRTDIHISLTANAGSGKTFVLSRRYVDIAVSSVKSLNEMVAITFTEKAAGELQKKISDEIERRISEEKEPVKLKKLISLRRQLVSANISTIHSFCINILKEFSPEAGIDANFIPADPETATELLELSLEEAYRAMLADETGNERVKSLVRILGSKSLLFTETRSAVNSRKKIIDLGKTLYSRSDEEIANFFSETFEDYFTQIFDTKIDRLIHLTRQINNEVLNVDPENETALHIRDVLVSYGKAESLQEKVSLSLNIADSISTSGGSLKKRGYTSKVKGNDFAAESEKIEFLVSDLRKIEIPENTGESELALARFGLDFYNFFSSVFEFYTDKKYKSGYLDFEDILLLTRDLLEKEEVSKYLASTYKYIMIDEYQDTNEIQYEIFMPVLENLRKNNLFVVGDEKQSIYRFREAELRVFRQTKDDIIKAKSEAGILNLPHSFRVAPPIALLVNKIFSELFKNPETLYNEVEHNDLLCARPKNDTGSVNLILLNKKDEEVISESDAVSGEILELNRNGKDFSDIAILCRKRKHFPLIEAAFIKNKIPFTIIGGKGFFQNQIIYDVYNYLSFLMNTKNDAAFTGILRSPFFLADDRSVLELSLSLGYSYYEKFQNSDIPGKDKIATILEKHTGLAGKINLQLLLNAIVEDTGYLAAISAGDKSGQSVANLEKLISVAGSFSRQGMKTLYDFVTYLEDSIENSPDEPQAELVRDDNSVKVMTVHQSKGLEFDTIFLFGSNDTLLNDNVKSRSVNIDPQFGILTKVPQGDDYFSPYVSPPVNGVYNYINERKNEAELKRLFYVAVTRAVNHLYITGTHKDYSFEKKSFLGFFNDSLNADLSLNEYRISDKLSFMGTAETKFAVDEADVSLMINIKHNPQYDFSYSGIKKEEYEEREIKTEVITDRQSGEIISATKIAIFKQCPLKYSLTYETGYSGLLTALREDNFPRLPEPENEEQQDELSGRADITGTVVHAVLEKNPAKENIAETVDKFVSMEMLKHSLTSGEVEGIKSEAVKLVSDFYMTDIYREINSSGNYFNELEIYVKQEDYYLYGIIDKFTDTDDRYIITDYKTDKITAGSAAEKAERYFPQLKFYAVLANKFRGVKKTEVKLVFLKAPELSFNRIIEPDEIARFSEEITGIINKIRDKKFDKNPEHCFACYFSGNGECPVK